MKKLNIGIIGAGGYWSQNIIRDLRALENAQIIHLCDINYESTRQYQTIYRITDKAEEVFSNLEVDAVIICTRANSHFPLAKEAILNKKHCWLEKPMTQISKEAEELVKLAKENNVILHVDHTFLYSNPVNYFKKQIESGILGDLYYIESIRTNYGPFMTDINCIADLCPHDFSILNYIVGKLPYSISAVGSSNININKGIIDEARITLNYDNFNAYVNVSWLARDKSRKITIAGEFGFLTNNSATDENVEYYNPKNGFSLLKSTSDGISALKKELVHFIECINLNKESNISNGSHGLEVMRMIEAANESIKTGIKIKL